MKENLTNRCQACHPDATINFPDSWLSHYIPSPESNPVMYYVDRFYYVFIPVVVGGMGILVALDISKLARTRLLKAGKKVTTQEQAEPPQAQSASNTANEEDQHGSLNKPNSAHISW